MFLTSTRHSENLTVEIFVADGTMLFSLEIVGNGEEGGGGIHGGSPGGEAGIGVVEDVGFILASVC